MDIAIALTLALLGVCVWLGLTCFEGVEPGAVTMLFAEDLAETLGLVRRQKRPITILNGYELEHLGEREKSLFRRLVLLLQTNVEQH